MGFLIFILFIWLLILNSKVMDLEYVIKTLREKQGLLQSELRLLKKNAEIKVESKKEEEVLSNTSNTVNTVEKIVGTSEEIINTEYYEEEEYEEEYEEDNEEEVEYNPPKKITVTTTKKVDTSFENMFLGNIFTIIGAIAIIVACGIFIKMISSYITFTPLMKTIIGFLVGLGLITGSIFTKKDSNLKMYSEVLMGTGFSTLFITTLCSTVIFKVFNSITCSIIAGLVLIMAYIVADKQKTISMIAIALIGGYMNIFFATDISPTMAFGYIIFLNLLSVIYTYRNPDKECINIINLIISLIFITIIMLFENKVGIIYPVILWLIYLIFDLIKNCQGKNTDEFNILNWVNFGVLTMFSLVIYGNNKMPIGITLISMAIMYNIILAMLLITNSQKFKPYLYSMLITILLSIYFLLDDVARIAAWSLFGLIIAIVVKSLDKEYLKNWIFVFFTPAITNLFFIDGVINYLSDYVAIFNVRFLAFSFPIVGTYVSYLLMKDMNNQTLKNISQVFKFTSISLLYLCCFVELSNYLNEQQVLKGFLSLMPLIMVGFIYSLQMKKLSMISNFPAFSYAAYLVGAISLLLLIAFGSSYEPISAFIPVFNIRCLTFITAIGFVILYQRWTKLDIFKYIATILAFVLVTFEVSNYVDKYDSSNITYLISLVWLLFSGIITIIGILIKKDYLKHVGIFTSILTIIRIIFYDLSNIQVEYKLLIFVAIGAIFMFISYLYNKNKNRYPN